MKKMFMQGGRVERKEAWFYCMGIYGQNLACALMMNWFMIFCTDVLYVDGIIVGLVLGIARVWDSVNDPVIGTMIDRHRFKNGEKFRPLLRATPIVIGIIIVMLFTDWGFQGDMPKAIYILVLYLAYDMVFTVQDVSMWSMTSVMTDVPAEREKISQWGRIVAAFGFGMVGMFPTVMDALMQQGVAKKYIFFGAAVVFGIGGMLLGVPITASLYKLLENDVDRRIKKK
jgi:Na+/melibiose symporter-like transporter